MSLSQRRTHLVGRLRSRKSRERERLVLVEGVRACDEALRAGADVVFAVTAPRLSATEPGAALAARLRALLAPDDVHTVTDEGLAELADTRAPQGVLMVCREPAVSIADVRAGRLLVLDGVQDPGNAGTLIRGVVAFGLDGVVCLDGTVDPWGAKTVRASAGLLFRCPPVLVAAGACLDALAVLDVPLWVADAAGEDAESYRGATSFALAVGNEGAGVRRELSTAAAAVVAVRMRGPAESLNAGVAGSILMHTLSVGARDE